MKKFASFICRLYSDLFDALSITAFAQPDPAMRYTVRIHRAAGAVCNGDNVGCLRDAYFDDVYPAGVTIGGGLQFFSYYGWRG
jgi:hypothetical protein